MFPIRGYKYTWSKEKDVEIKKTRGVCFKDVVYAIQQGDVVDIIKNPLAVKYPKQWHLVVLIKGYPYVVPFVIDGDACFFKTIYANRKYKE